MNTEPTELEALQRQLTLERTAREEVELKLMVSEGLLAATQLKLERARKVEQELSEHLNKTRLYLEEIWDKYNQAVERTEK